MSEKINKALEEKEFNSKLDVARFVLFELIKEQGIDVYLKRKELLKEAKVIIQNSDYKEISDANLSLGLRMITNAENTPILKNPQVRGEYSFDENKTGFDVSELILPDYSTATSGSNKGKLESKAISILIDAKKDIVDLLSKEQIPLSVLVSDNSDELQKYKAKVAGVQEIVNEVNIIIDSYNER